MALFRDAGDGVPKPWAVPVSTRPVTTPHPHLTQPSSSLISVSSLSLSKILPNLSLLFGNESKSQDPIQITFQARRGFPSIPEARRTRSAEGFADQRHSAPSQLALAEPIFYVQLRLLFSVAATGSRLFFL